MLDFYIEPELKAFNSLEDLNDYYLLPSYSRYIKNRDVSIDFSSLFNDSNHRAFIIADPGYGKSELIKQIGEKFEADKKGVKSINLPGCVKEKGPINILKQFDKNYSIYCFDALDEVPYNLYNGTII